jgi:hypothetical protein
LTLADGNPRLLEFLNNKVLGEQNAQAKLTQLEQSPELWKDKIIWEELYLLINTPLQQTLSHCLIYEIPVPMAALEVVCESLSDYKLQLQRGINLGLIGISSDIQEEDREYRISRILPHILPNTQLPQNEKLLSTLSGKAGDELSRLWVEDENEEKWNEIFRLVFSERENRNRFRKGFSWVIKSQVNIVSERAFNFQLRKKINELNYENLCAELELYLKNQQWKEADEETAWIFYQVMIIEKIEDWHDLMREIPVLILKQINDLWLNNSDQHFGFSIQKKIWNNIVENSKPTYEDWNEFGKEVGWYDNFGDWAEYVHIRFTKNEPIGHLPALWATLDVVGGGWMVWGYVAWGGVGGSCLLSRVEI